MRKRSLTSVRDGSTLAGMSRDWTSTSMKEQQRSPRARIISIPPADSGLSNFQSHNRGVISRFPNAAIGSNSSIYYLDQMIQAEGVFSHQDCLQPHTSKFFPSLVLGFHQPIGIEEEGVSFAEWDTPFAKSPSRKQP